VEISQEEVNATDLDANPEEIDVVVEQQIIPNEEMKVETIKALGIDMGISIWL
jgi:hypothetical protein